MRAARKSERHQGDARRGEAHAPISERSRDTFGGRPLDPAVRSVAEARFGHDFGSVRVHAGEDANSSADAIEAAAYTAGREIVLSDQIDIDQPAGRWVLAHELAHVIQQEGAERLCDGEAEIGGVNTVAEGHAEKAAAIAMLGAGQVTSIAPETVAPVTGGGAQRYLANPDLWDAMPSLDELPGMAGGAVSGAGDWLGGTLAGLGASKGASAISAGVNLGSGIGSAGSWLGDLIGGDTGAAVSQGAGDLGSLAMTGGSLLGGGLISGGAQLGAGVSNIGSTLGGAVAGLGDLDPSWLLM
jgi:hypothetical protein